VPLKCPSPQRQLGDHGDELESRQAGQNPLAFPISGTRPQSCWPGGGEPTAAWRLARRAAARTRTWSGRKHSDTFKTEPSRSFRIAILEAELRGTHRTATPDHLNLHQALADAYGRLGNYRQALKHAKRLLPH
jgi:hypothetical protein